MATTPEPDDVRAVPIGREQMRFVEDVGLDLMRTGEYESGTRLLTLALAWKVTPRQKLHEYVERLAVKYPAQAGVHHRPDLRLVRDEDEEEPCSGR